MQVYILVYCCMPDMYVFYNMGSTIVSSELLHKYVNETSLQFE